MAKEKEIRVSGAEIQEVLSNPDKTFDTLREFCGDVEALTESMHNLYEQHPIEFALLGVQVEVIVKSQALGTEFVHSRFGSKSPIPVPKEEADGHRRAV